MAQCFIRTRGVGSITIARRRCRAFRHALHPIPTRSLDRLPSNSIQGTHTTPLSFVSHGAVFGNEQNHHNPQGGSMIYKFVQMTALTGAMALGLLAANKPKTVIHVVTIQWKPGTT